LKAVSTSTSIARVPSISEHDWKPFSPQVEPVESMDFDKKEKASVQAVDPFEDQIEPLREPPFSDQALKPTFSVPPEYGKEHEATRVHHVDTLDESNLVDPKVKNTKRQRLKRHCMRYWICYFIANIILLAILLPITWVISILLVR
jgi:hypothetical protein